MMLSQLEISMLLNHHLPQTHLQILPEIQFPTNHRGGKWLQHMTKEEKIFSRNKSPHVLTTNTYLLFFSSNLQTQFEELHMVRLSQASYDVSTPCRAKMVILGPHGTVTPSDLPQWVSSLTNDSRNFLWEDPESSSFTKDGTQSGKAEFTDLRREEATATSNCP